LYPIHPIDPTGAGILGEELHSLCDLHCIEVIEVAICLLDVTGIIAVACDLGDHLCVDLALAV